MTKSHQQMNCSEPSAFQSLAKTNARQNGQPLLAVLECRADCGRLLRWTSDRARTLGAPWLALYVQTTPGLTSDEQARLTMNMSLARDLGAEALTVSEAELRSGIQRIASERSVSEIVISTLTGGPWSKRWERDLLIRRLARSTRDRVIHLVPVSVAAEQRSSRTPTTLSKTKLPQYAMAVGVVGAVTAAGFVFTPIAGPHATALVFLLMVVLVALIVDRGPTLLAATLSALSWEYFFLPPTFAFRIQHFEDGMLFGMYFVVALVLGQLTARIRAQEEAERRRQERATALFLLTRELSRATDPDDLAQRLVRQVETVFEADVAFVPSAFEDSFTTHPASTRPVPAGDHPVVTWVFRNKQPAGKFCATYDSAQGMYLPLRGMGPVVGVLGLYISRPGGLSVFQQNLLEDFSQQIAQALDRQRLSHISEKARLLAESERLSKTLLDSMSHEMRTPLAAIRSATGNLAQMSERFSTSEQRQMLAEMEEATERLDRLVGKVLEVSRLESGKVRPRFNECDVRELIHVCVAETERVMNCHDLRVTMAPDLPLVRMDFVLMQQVLTNLLSNAACHTPPGTLVELTARVEGENLVWSVADNGPGIAAECLARIFDKFYRAPNAPTGGTGLGLSLVKGFVEAQGGKVQAANRSGGGAVFKVSLPIGSEMLAEQSNR